MNDSPEQSVSALPEGVAARMRDILARHASDYRQDLPRLIDQMHGYAAHAADHEHWLEFQPVLMREAHDMKGQAATFGYPLLSTVAQSLCRLLDRAPSGEPDYAGTVRAHVDAMSSLLTAEDPELVASVTARAQRLVAKD